ncbi:MAG: hypothetical protein ACHQ1D_03155 [Nitrososphaerales archaeon]
MFRASLFREKNFVLLIFASIFLIILAVTTNQVYAMGQSPSTCNNRYDGPITSATIISEGQTYDPIANPGLTIHVANDKSYSVIFTIHTPTQSSQGNSLPGTTWYRTTAPGYANGSCVDGASPDKDITIETSWSHPANMAAETTQTVEFGTRVSGFNFNVEWKNPSNIEPKSTETVSVNPIIGIIHLGSSVYGQTLQIKLDH